MADLEIIEHHPQRVMEAFRRGEFDQLEIIGEADEKEFFELCLREKILPVLAESMPTVRKKIEVPLWFQLSANLSLKLHQENSYAAFEQVAQGGGLARRPASGAGFQTPGSADPSHRDQVCRFQ